MTSPLFSVIYEDNHLLVVDKAAGVLTQPTDKENESLEVLLKDWIKEKYQKPGNVFLGVIHRLDKPVRGIVVFAKTSKALSRLNESLRQRTAKKTYCALIEGELPNESGTLKNYIRHDDYRATISSPNDPAAKLAILHYKLRKKNQKTSLIEIDLETGRYHQIRVQLSSIGCPIVGDKKYDSSVSYFSDVGIALTHCRLEIPHPTTQELLHFEIPLPQEWVKPNSL